MIHSLHDGAIVQVCFVVPDLDLAMEHWTTTLAVGPFFAKKQMGRIPCVFRGEPSYIDVSAAFGQGGAVQIELIELHDNNPSVYRDMFQHGDGGFHHVARFVDNLPEAVQAWERRGCDVAMSGDFAGTPYAYIDARRLLGSFIELYEESPSMRLLYRRVADAAEGWNGSDPVRPMDNLFV